ncbi:protein tfg [Plakobranchus ocellatus]|uniref:Protein tfg n=1 Tax=Plakobranchus ocellatus TaxID=259542 RepID=A0AAV3Z5D6_9GAST|nr:protein tfg [Plakobranchus ocellatus]
MQNSGSPQFDLTGKLIIKVALGDDIRRIPIHNEDITYDELVLMMQRVYRGKLSTNDEITIKYKDEDGDLITIFDSSDLTFAIQCSRILKITLFVGGPSKSLLEPSSVSSIRSELQAIRDRVLGLLDRLEPVSIVKGTQALSIADGGSAKDDVGLNLGANNNKTGSSRPVNALGGKEFDPLTTQKSVEENVQNKVAASFGIDGGVGSTPGFDRAATPDSVSSIGSSSSNQVRAQQAQAAQQFRPGSASQQQDGHQQQHQPSPSHQPQQVPQQHPQQHLQQQQQQQQPQPYPGQMTQPYAGQPGYGAAPPPGQQMPPQQQQQPQQQPPHLQQHQQQAMPHTSQPYDPNMYGQYNQGYPPAAGPPGQPGMPQGTMGYSQPGGPNPYGQTMPGRAPQAQDFAAPGATPSPSNPYSRGGFGAGYPRPTAGYPQ